jgi:NAD(P)-dependent dehydrogenase (short-subunit alcohol dehydrogenase family)
MIKRFDGRVVLVTGASSGIGRAIAEAFAREGAKVVVTGRRREQTEETLALVRAAGSDGVAVVGDVSRSADVQRMVAGAVSAFGRLDCAVNNAGIEGGKAFVPTADAAEDIWDEVIAINLTGVFLCMKYEIRQMLTQGGGAIVNMSSVAGLIGTRVGIAYGASKHGVIGATRAAAMEYAAQGRHDRPPPDGAARHDRRGGRCRVVAVFRRVVVHDRTRAAGRRRPHSALTARRRALPPYTGRPCATTRS